MPLIQPPSSISIAPKLLVSPNVAAGYGQLWAQGWQPFGFNQQWGGPFGGQMPDGSEGEAWWYGIIPWNAGLNMGYDATEADAAHGFYADSTGVHDVVAIRIHSKVGNPTDNLEISIQGDNSGEPDGTPIGNTVTYPMQATIDGCIVVVNGLAASLSAGTRYWVVFSRSGSNDSSNYLLLGVNDEIHPDAVAMRDVSGTWTDQSKNIACLVSSASDMLQTGGIFNNGKLVCFEAENLYQSHALSIATRYLNSINPDAGTLLWRGTISSASKPILDLNVGSLDVNRIRLSTTAAGLAHVECWEDDGTLHEITGTTDLTNGGAGDVAHDVAVVWSTGGITLYVDAISEGTPVSSSIALGDVIKDRGILHFGGRPSAPTWSKVFDMSSLPSVDGDTSWQGSATEANAMIVNNGILTQNQAGYASTDNGYYRVTTTFNNTNGWYVEYAVQILNESTGAAQEFVIWDGTKLVFTRQFSNYLSIHPDGNSYYVQVDLHSRMRTIGIQGKGSDFYIYIDGELVFDGTGKLLSSASSSNKIEFGDRITSSGINAGINWGQINLYYGGEQPFSCAAMEVSEVGLWGFDASEYLEKLYNSGDQKSIAEICGNPGPIPAIAPISIQKQGITLDPALTTTFSLVPEMDAFILTPGGRLALKHHALVSNSGGKDVTAGFYLDGIELTPFQYMYSYDQDTLVLQTLSGEWLSDVSAGLHHAEVRADESSSSAGSYEDDARNFIVGVVQ